MTYEQDEIFEVRFTNADAKNAAMMVKHFTACAAIFTMVHVFSAVHVANFTSLFWHVIGW